MASLRSSNGANVLLAGLDRQDTHDWVRNISGALQLIFDTASGSLSWVLPSALTARPALNQDEPDGMQHTLLTCPVCRVPKRCAVE